MSDVNLILYITGIFIFSIVATGFIRSYSVHKSIVDIPNERSLHSRPTPRGGGVPVVLSILASIALLYYLQLLPLDITIAFGGGGLIVAVTGWLDDCRGIPEIRKALSYTFAAIWAIYWLDGLETLSFGEDLIILSIVGNIFVVLGLTWLINLYNFMDGTDAFAAIQAICTGTFSGFLFESMGRQDMAVLCFVIATSSAGFLWWNWPTAKIFMGDVGSCFIGYSFGVLAIIGEQSGILPVIVMYILLSIFICDASLTLFLRMLKKEKWYRAHRSHAYQILVQMGVSQKILAIGLLLINVIILWPLAYIALHWEHLSLFMVYITAISLFILWASIKYYFIRNYAH